MPALALPTRPKSGSSHAGLGFDLFQRFLNQRFVVFARNLAAQNLRCNRDGQVNRLVPDLLYGASRLEARPRRRAP
jgi:hypothetical protein